MKTNLDEPFTVRIKIIPPAPKNGKRWQPVEQAYLEKCALRGDTVDRMALLLGRSRTSITAKLTEMRYLGFNRGRMRFEWNPRKVSRTDFVYITHDNLDIAASKVQKLYLICKEIAG